MTEIVDLSEFRKQKVETARQESLKNLPATYVEYLKAREIQISQMKLLMTSIDRFEKETLTFSKNQKLTGPTIDEYLLNKASIAYATDVLHATDAKIKEFYPFAELPPISL